MPSIEFVGIILDIDYVIRDDRGVIRITFKSKDGTHVLYDYNFLPYFYITPENASLDPKSIIDLKVDMGIDGVVGATDIVKETKFLQGKETQVLKITIANPKHVPKMSTAFKEFGQRYEHDIIFWKRYLIDKDVSPLVPIRATAHEEDGEIRIDSIEKTDAELGIELSHICFDIEVTNPLGQPREKIDPVIMVSYTDGKKAEVLTYKQIDREFVYKYDDEKALIQGFVDKINEINPDIISGYNSSNFDLPYLSKRAATNKMEFAINRIDGRVRGEHHGIVEAFKIPGRINLDIYNVARFVQIVGAAEQLLKVNSLKLYEVYGAVTGKKKKMVEKTEIWKIWDGSDEDREELADYSLSDSITLDKLYDFFLPLEVEIAKVSGTTLAESAVSTTGQLVEYLLMKYAHMNNELIPNKPSYNDITYRLANPIQGAYVIKPEPGIYNNIAVFDFRSLYPSIIIAHNIDNSSFSMDAKDYFESPNGFKFKKNPKGIMPRILKMLLEQRKEVKKAYKKDPDNKALGARSQALKILANSFYGYLGYARSRWYSRECASSVTAFGRSFITQISEEAVKEGFKVLYGDTDSVFLIVGNKTKDDALAFAQHVNDMLPQEMELELEDFYTRGVFVGKKGANGGGAKKKYALLSESGRIKIKGFELVRRDWSHVARQTQKAVLEALLKEGSKEKAASIVKDIIQKVRSGKMPLQDFVMRTQIRKSISSYEIKSPELSAAKKAVEKGFKKRDEVEGAMIGYIITTHGNTISEKAEIEGLADNYDPNYYIEHQILPATLKILKELGFSPDELKGLGSQKKL